MRIRVPEGEVITVILASGARLVGPYDGDGLDCVLVDGWAIDPDKIQGWKMGEHPWRRPGAKAKEQAGDYEITRSVY